MSTNAPTSTGNAAQGLSATSVPVLGDGFQESRILSAEPATAEASTESSGDEHDDNAEAGKKAGVRRLFGLGRKKDDMEGKGKNKAGLQLANARVQEPSTLKSASVLPTTPNHPYMARSPERTLSSSSPRAVSPAGSQIFERDVQDSTTLPAMPASPVPGHLQVDDHIPSVLDASSEAITNKSLNPDTVEIVMHSSHQPAAVTVGGISSSESMTNSWAEDLVSHPDKDDAASNYGALDAADVRRLSFISFADVIQSEHAEHAGGRELSQVPGLTSLSSGARSPSPMQSPVSSQGFNTSPPTSKSASIKGLEFSPTRGGKPLASPTMSSHTSGMSGGELMIETMSQALRKTQSGDLSGVKGPVSPDGLSERVMR